jgi:hypothetical protein
MSTTEQSKWADKIAKLLRKAEGAQTTEEAEAFFSKAQELMSKYAIDEAMLRHAGGDQRNDIVREEFVMTGIYRFALSTLCYYVLKANDIETVQLGGKNPRRVGDKIMRETIVYIAVGYKNDIDRARLLYTSLELQALSAMTNWSKQNAEHLEMVKLVRGGKADHYEKRQFIESFAYGVNDKLTAAKKRGTEAAEHEHGKDSVALVVRDKGLAVRDALEDMFPHLRKGRARNMQGGTMASHNAGKAAGQRADTGDPSLRQRQQQLGK